MTHSASGLDEDDLNLLSNHLPLEAQTRYGFDHLSAGSHPMVSQAVKAVFLPKCINTFVVSLVFTYIVRLPTNEALTLKQLTFKTLFLLTSSTISRLSSMGRLGPQLLVYEVIMIELAVTHVYSYFSGSLCFISYFSEEAGKTWQCAWLSPYSEVQ